MNVPYPPFKMSQLLLLVVLLSTSATAQDNAYVAVTQPKKSTSGHYVKKADAVIRIAERTERKVTLLWPSFSGEVSHYVLERSFDGRNYDEAAVLFTGGVNDETAYTFTDKFRQVYLGVVYYRLRVVGFDETELYTLPSMSNRKN